MVTIHFKNKETLEISEEVAVNLAKRIGDKGASRWQILFENNKEEKLMYMFNLDEVVYIK